MKLVFVIISLLSLPLTGNADFYGLGIREPIARDWHSCVLAAPLVVTLTETRAQHQVTAVSYSPERIYTLVNEAQPDPLYMVTIRSQDGSEAHVTHYTLSPESVAKLEALKCAPRR